jgi:glutamate carboxypeptidase
MANLNPAEARICTWLADNHAAMVALLKESVDTGSGSYDKTGVDAVGRVFERFFAGHGLPTTREAHDTFGDGPSRYRVPEGRRETPSVHHQG